MDDWVRKNTYPVALTGNYISNPGAIMHSDYAMTFEKNKAY